MTTLLCTSQSPEEESAVMALQSNEQSNTTTKHTQEIRFAMVAAIIILKPFKDCQYQPRLHYVHCTMQYFMHCSAIHIISRPSAPTGRGYKKSCTTYAEWIEKPLTFLWSNLCQDFMPVSLSHTMCGRTYHHTPTSVVDPGGDMSPPFNFNDIHNFHMGKNN